MSTPNLAMIPCGYKAGKLYSALPTDGSGDLTVARASKKHKVNSDLELEIIDNNIPAFNYDAIGGCPFLNTEPQATNLITYPISFANSYWTKSGASIKGDPSTVGAERVTNGGFDSDTGWTKGTGWTIGGGVATCDGSAGVYSYILQNTIFEAGKTYLVEFDVITATGALNVWVDGVQLIVASAVGGTNYSLLVYATISGSLSFESQSGFTSVIDNASVKEIQGYSAPSVDFPTSAFKFSQTSVSDYMSFGSSSSGSNTVTLSFFAKADTLSDFRLIESFYTGVSASFDLSNGTSVGGDIYEYANGWFKCSVSFPYGVGQTIISAELKLDAVGSVYIFMAQAEVGSVATSPTFTDTTLASEGSTTTRLADVVNNLNATSYTDSLSGVLFAEVSALGNSGTYRTLSLNDAIDTNRIEMYYRPDAEKMSFYVSIGGGGIINYTHTFTDATVMHKVAIKWSVGDFGVFVNGVKVNSSNSTAVFTSNVLTKLSFTNATGGEIFGGNTKQLQVYGTALTDAECITLTTL